MSPVPDFIIEVRRMVGHHPLWLPGVTAVITRGDDHVLLVRRSDNGAWTPVTGIADPGEEPAVTAAREATEETGVRIRVDRLAATSVHPEVTYENGDRAAYLDLTFACTWLEGEAHVADDESSDVRWWPLSGLPEMSDLMLARIEAATSGEREARFVAPPGREDEEPPPVLAPDVPVLGVDACPSGWVGVVIDPDRRTSVFTAATITSLVGLVRETYDVPVIAVDIPVGLPALREKVLELDAWVRSGPGVEVVEVDPDLSFARMGGSPVLASKKDADGVRARREALAAHGIAAPPWFRGSGFAEDDLLDACAAAWSSVRHSLGLSESAPGTPEVFPDGIPAAVRV